MPGTAAPVTDERDALRAFLVQQQDGFRNAAFGLTDDQAARAASSPSTLTVGTLVKHVTQVQESWLAQAVAAPAEPDDPRSFEEKAAAHTAGWTWLADDRLDDVLAAYDDTCARVLD